ncbi:response regulator transcription factor [Actinomycetospora corticicola]|uniref:DNA-binding response OmpR family regulator n=1 Tax=Actinomycetospora corticicola TaxID=663602 RepID=A0A7Y9J5M3_9PSEU|nr:DNA-binding response OmpR family regulator [Actinomycetospora corticicola]
MPRVLVVDDEPGVRAALVRGLGAEGMDVVAVGDGPAGLAEASTGTFDAVVLDIILPGLSGYRVLEQLRADGVETPVLLLSAKDGEVDQADGLDLGADGYVVKPFSFVVLVAQLRALLRRRTPSAPRLVVGALTVDGEAATWAGAEIGLSARELAVLRFLAGRPGVVVTKDELLTAVWGDGAAARNVVEVYVGYLRRKLAAVGADGLVVTERGRGYRLHPPS